MPVGLFTCADTCAYVVCNVANAMASLRLSPDAVLTMMAPHILVIIIFVGRKNSSVQKF